MFIVKKLIFIDIIRACLKKRFFIGFFISLFFSFFYFFILKYQALLIHEYKYFFYFLVFLHIYLYLKYCMNINFSQKNAFFISALIFTIIIISIIGIGSLWIFDHLNH